MTAIVKKCADAYVYVHAGVFIASIVLQALAGLTLATLFVLGIFGVFS